MTDALENQNGEGGDAVELALAKARAKAEAEKMVNESEGQDLPGSNNAEKALNFGMWIAKRKDIVATTESIIADFGLSIFILDAIWVWDNTIMAAKKKWPIEATIVLLTVTLMYVFAIIIVLAILAIIIDFGMHPVSGTLDAMWNWGLGTAVDLIKLFAGLFLNKS